MNSGSNWWAELVILLATIELYLLVVVWRLVKKIKNNKREKLMKAVNCQVSPECHLPEKVQHLEEEVSRLKDAVLIAAPVMKAHAEPTSFANFVAFSGRRKGD